MIVSIIIPVYNTEAYLSVCLESILSQSFSDFEVLLIDDGSKDRSGAICDEYAARDSRIRVLHKENEGVSLARNLALGIAKGDWICFIDSDDQLSVGGLKELTDGISDQVDMVMAGYIEATHPLEEAGFEPGERKIVTREDVMVSMFNNTGRKYEGYIGAKLFRRDLIVKEHIAFDPSISFKEDTLFVVSFLGLSNRKVYVSDAQVYHYIHRSSSAMESLKETYNPGYLTSFKATCKINHLVKSFFPNNSQLQYLSQEELINRVFWVLGLMIRYNALDKGIVLQLKRRTLKEVGIAHYLSFQCRRNKRRATRIINRLFKISFHV